jgi:hypothetical protein
VRDPRPTPAARISDFLYHDPPRTQGPISSFPKARAGVPCPGGREHGFARKKRRFAQIETTETETTFAAKIAENAERNSNNSNNNNNNGTCF